MKGELQEQRYVVSDDRMMRHLNSGLHLPYFGSLINSLHSNITHDVVLLGIFLELHVSGWL